MTIARDWIASFGEIAKFCGRVMGLVYGLRVFRFFGESLRQAGILILSSTLGVFAFNYVFTQTLLATHPEIINIK